MTNPVLTDDLIAELETAANAATPGPWGHIRINEISWVASEEWEILDLRCDKPLDAEDGEFIAQANPATILALLAERADLKQQLAAASVDAERLNSIEENCWDVRYGSQPNADAGDSNISIEIVGHFMGQPFERVVGENYNENLRAAIDQAMTADAYPPARPEYDEADDAPAG